MILRKLALGFEHPGRGPAQADVAGLPALYVAGGAAGSDVVVDSIGLVL
jgi:hypothetical protein